MIKDPVGMVSAFIRHEDKRNTNPKTTLNTLMLNPVMVDKPESLSLFILAF
jgi:hypothetical protein